VNASTTDTNKTASLGDGTYYWRVASCDDAGCTYSANQSLVVDATSPVISITFPHNGTQINNSFFTSTISITESHLDTCRYNLTNSTSVVSSGSWENTTSKSITFTSLISDDHQIAVSCNDTLGLQGDAEVDFTVNDTTVTGINITESQSGTNPVTVTFTVYSNEPAVCKGDGTSYYGQDLNYSVLIYDMTTSDGLVHTYDHEFSEDISSYFYAKCNDSNGNVMEDAEWEWFVVDVTETTNDGGSSGGGGGAYYYYDDEENYTVPEEEPVEVPETRELSAATETDSTEGAFSVVGGKGTVTVTDSNLAITEISIDEDKEFAVEIKKIPYVVDAPKLNNTYQYLEIGSDLTDFKGKIRFRVPKSWVMEGNFTDVNLYIFEEDAWKELSTKFIEGDDQYAVYEAKTESFGYFAIVGEEGLHLGTGVKNIVGGAVAWLKGHNPFDFELSRTKKILIGLGASILALFVIYLVISRKD
jgi:PGF-pre-PGF domain-containing protein